MREHCVQIYQVFDQVLQLLLGQTNCFFFANDGDHLLLAVVWRWENDAGASLVPHTANVGSTAADQEFMILGFGLQLSGEVVDLLNTKKEEIQFLLLQASPRVPPPTFSSASCSSCFFAFSTSLAGPLMVTLSEPEPSEGK